jgi:Trypsin-like peptidase domain
MANRIQLLFVSLGYLLGSSLSPGLPTQVDGLELQKTAVAQIKISHPGGSQETAAGFYVGKDAQFAYFATAFHAVKNGSGGVVDTVTVQLEQSPQDISASVLKHFDPDLDLAVVMVPHEYFTADSSQIALRDPALNGAIHIIGHPPAGGWSVWPGTVQNVSGDPRRFTTTADRSLTGGYSGGPILNAEGFLVGMHIDNTGTYGRGVKASEVIGQLVAWRVPVNGFRSTDVTAGLSAEDPVKEACMNGSILDCHNYSGSIFVKCNQFDPACKLLARCWEDKARALQVVEFACKRNDQSCELQKENMRKTSQMDCDKESLKNL